MYLVLEDPKMKKHFKIFIFEPNFEAENKNFQKSCHRQRRFDICFDLIRNHPPHEKMNKSYDGSV